jgi:AcrR family transcriptional regulator
MKHVSPTEVAAQARSKSPTRRALAKQQTRQKVLAAARKLFGEKGYQGATIRDIAAEAGMSTGAVFANFADKSDLFAEIMATDQEQIASDMRAAVSAGGTVEDLLLRMFVAGYAFYRKQMPLARAGLVAVWSDEEGGRAMRSLEQKDVIPRLIAEQINAAVERGELCAKADVDLRAHMIFETYIYNFRPAFLEGWDIATLEARSRDQIRILVEGARK